MKNLFGIFWLGEALFCCLSLVDLTSVNPELDDTLMSAQGQALAAGMGLFVHSSRFLAKCSVSQGEQFPGAVESGYLDTTWLICIKAKRVPRVVFRATQWPLLRLRAVFAELSPFVSRTVCYSSQAYVKSQCGLLRRAS